MKMCENLYLTFHMFQIEMLDFISNIEWVMSKTNKTKMLLLNLNSDFTFELSSGEQIGHNH